METTHIERYNKMQLIEKASHTQQNTTIKTFLHRFDFFKMYLTKSHNLLNHSIDSINEILTGMTAFMSNKTLSPSTFLTNH